MCLVINPNKHNLLDNNDFPVAFIAEKDIIVWKILTNDNISIFEDYQYGPNKSYPEVAFGKDNNLDYLIHAGYHAYVSRQYARNAKNSDMIFYSNCKVVKFIIPKGAYYYIGWDDDIVANKIISGDLKSS